MATLHVSTGPQSPQTSPSQSDTVTVVNPPPVKPKNVISLKAQQFFIFLYTFIAVLLTFRFVLAFLGARQESPFVAMVYQLSVPFMLPFTNMFGRSLQVAQYRLEFEVLVALLVYAVVFYGIAKLVSIIFD